MNSQENQEVMPKEIETKFKIESESALKRGLKKMGAKFISKKLERDTYYYNSSSQYHPTIRLRTVSNKGIFTVKTQTPGEKSHTYKVREELEVAVSDVKTFCKMLEILGFAPHFRKEKIRETYHWKDARIFIDELPFIGFYVEIEAPKKRIKEIAALLGLDMSNATSDTYMQLFNYYKVINKKPKLELIFKNR